MAAVSRGYRDPLTASPTFLSGIQRALCTASTFWTFLLPFSLTLRCPHLCSAVCIKIFHVRFITDHHSLFSTVPFRVSFREFHPGPQQGSPPLLHLSAVTLTSSGSVEHCSCEILCSLLSPRLILPGDLHPCDFNPQLQAEFPLISPAQISLLTYKRSILQF